MFCKRCGYELTKDSKFCYNCGLEIVVENKQNINNENEANQKSLSHGKQNKKFIINFTIFMFILVSVLIYYDETKAIKIIISPKSTIDINGFEYFIKSATLNGISLNTTGESNLMVKPHKKYTLTWTTANKNGFGMFMNEESHMKEFIFSKNDNEKFLVFYWGKEARVLSIEERIADSQELNKKLGAYVEELKKKLIE